MRVLITGAAGFLGSHLCEAHLKAGNEVFGIDDLSGGDARNVPAGVYMHHADCKSLALMQAIISTDKLQVIYHAACCPTEGLSVFSPYMVGQSVYTASVAVMTAAINSGVKRVINFSSMAAFGHHDKVPFDEDTPRTPQDPYGVSKAAAEQTMSILARVHGIEFVNAIPHSIIGRNQKFDDAYRNVCSIFLNRMMQGKQPIIYGKGDQRRCFSPVKDMLPCLMEMGDLDRKDVVGEHFCVGPEDRFITILELAKICAGILNFPLDPIFVPERPQEVKNANCSSKKIQKWFGYKDSSSLEETLCEMVDWMKSRGAPKPFSYHLPIEIQSPLCPKTWSEELM